MKEKNQEIKHHIINNAECLAISFIKYDRRDDEDLSYEQLMGAIENKIITVDEIVETFKKSLINNLV